MGHHLTTKPPAVPNNSTVSLCFDAWSEKEKKEDETRSRASVDPRQSRFGIGDVYFLAISMGKCEVIVDDAWGPEQSLHQLACFFLGPPVPVSRFFLGGGFP